GSLSNAHAVAATTLSAVKGLIGRSQQFGARTGMNRKRSDSDGRCDAAVIRNVELLDARAQSFSDDQRAVRIGLRQDQDKFIAAKPRRGIHVSQFLANDA